MPKSQKTNNNSIIIDGIEIINSQKFIDVGFILEKLPWVKILDLNTEKGTGKTTSAQLYGVKNYILKDKNIAEIRNTDEELKQSVVEPFIEMFDDLQLKATINRYGIKYKNKKRATFIYLSRVGTFAGKNAKCEYIIWDEIIDADQSRQFHLPNFNIEFKKLINTITRPLWFKTITLSNPHSCEHDYFYYAGINHNWDALKNGNVSIITDKKRGLLSVWIPEGWFDLKEMEKNKKCVNDLFVGEETKKVFHYLSENNKVVYAWSQEIKEALKPIFKLTYNEHNFLIGSLLFKNKPHIYIKELSTPEELEHIKTPFYCVDLFDKKKWNKLDEDGDCVENIYNYYINSNIIYSTAYAKETMNELLSMNQYQKEQI